MVLLLLAVTPLTSFGQEEGTHAGKDAPVWEIEFAVPDDWHVNANGSTGIFLSTGEEKSWVPDVPPQPQPWFILMRRTGVCDKDKALSQFFRSDDGRPLRVALGCKLGLIVIGGYWDSDKEQDKRALQMMEMYASMRFRR